MSGDPVGFSLEGRETGKNTSLLDRPGAGRFRGIDPSIRKILFFPDSDDLNDEHIVMDEKCCPVFPDAKPVSRHFLRAVPDFYHIAALVRTCGKPFQGKLDPNADFLRDRRQIFFSTP